MVRLPAVPRPGKPGRASGVESGYSECSYSSSGGIPALMHGRWVAPRVLRVPVVGPVAGLGPTRCRDPIVGGDFNLEPWVLTVGTSPPNGWHIFDNCREWIT